MYRTIRTSLRFLALAAVLVGFASIGLARETASVAPPSQGSQQVAPQQEQPQKGPLVYKGREDHPGLGELTFTFHSNGEVIMVDVDQKPVKGQLKIQGNRVQIIFSNCIYEGVEQGNVVVGKGQITAGPHSGVSWPFRVELVSGSAQNTTQAAPVQLQGLTYQGSENLGGYGQVAFRFLDNSNVEMIDKDGVTRGTYRINGNQIVLVFGGATYNGQLQGQTISGSASNPHQGYNWTFQVSLK